MSELLLVVEEKIYIPAVRNYVLVVPKLQYTENELKVIGFLTRHFTEKYSINQFAKQVGLSPKGTHKLLKRLEDAELVLPEKIANALFYHVDLNSDLARKAAELSLFERPDFPYARAKAQEFDRFRSLVKAAVLFGSVLRKGKEAGDVDVLIVLDDEKYEEFRKKLKELQEISTKIFHIVYQTPDDLVKNLKKPDPVVLEVLRTGRVLWGHETIVSSIKEALDK